MINNVKRHEIHETFSFGVIYIYSIPDESHEGRLKIGSATLIASEPKEEEIIAAAKERINQQTMTADVKYDLKHVELAVTNDNKYFSDTDVHDVLIRSGFARKSGNIKNYRSEWFEIDLATAKNAISAVKEGRAALSSSEKSNIKSIEFPFRPNQRDAIDKTSKAISQKRKHFLWNAKMRFGKTSAAMQVAKENGMKKVLIVTHRPSVSVDWYNDFNLVFAGTNYEYSSRDKGELISTLIKGDKPLVYFASLQDLRASKRVVEDEAAKSKAKGFDKNDEVFDTTWDMLIVDEAHEGTQSDLGGVTFSKIPANFTLQLSGTPFNILHKHEENDIYTWDYVMEQEEKLYWDENHPGVPNPYAELPSLSMFTYDIDKYASHIGSLGENFKDALDGAFKFHEFFRVYKDDDGNDTSEFVYETMVKKFLDLLVDNTLETQFPYATEEYRCYNKHSLWLLPNRVKVIEAMEKLLKMHDIFGKFGIVNISGSNRDDDEDKDAKDRVTKAIRNHDYTITLTGQRLTTGASIPEWTAVFMMSDTSSATAYLQTAFRCQTPAKIEGKLKTQGYVFDFAPDRTLRLIAEAIELNHKSGKVNTPEQRQAMGDFLNFCPILAAEGGTMKPYDVGTMLVQLKKAIIERVSRNGFDDPKLYNDELLQLDELDIKKFNDLKAIVGSATGERINEIPVNELGMDEVETSKAEEAERKMRQKMELTQVEKERLRKLKEAREQKNNAISILRAVSIRMPMMVYGANVSIKEDITLQKFIELVDEESWTEFMPTGLTKEAFREFTKYYDEEVFRGVAHSIRAKAFDIDDLLPTERIQAIVEIFGTFKNPDKETVLTPWNIVNMQISMTLGGHDFRNIINGRPEWKTQGVVTDIWTRNDTKILEINSKSGLYPLLAAYNIYSRQLIKHKKPEDKISRKLWMEVLSKNIYVLCKSPMAVSITRRTLVGYSGAKTNVVYIKDLVNKLQLKGIYKRYNIKNELIDLFNVGDKDMKFTAIVGNPPYQLSLGNEGGNSAKSKAIYHYFVDAAISLDSDYVSLILPSRWMTRTAEGISSEWVDKMLDDNHISLLHDYLDANNIFPNVDIKGGVCYFLRDKKQSGNCTRYVYKKDENGKITVKGPYDGPLRISRSDIVIRDIETIPLFNKIRKFEKDYTGYDYLTKSELNFSSLVSPKDFFTNKVVLTSSWNGYTAAKTSQNNIKVYLNRSLEGNGGFGWTNFNVIPKNKEAIQLEKVFIPAGSGTGNDRLVLGVPFYGEPGSVCTQTYLVIGYDNKKHKLNQSECNHIIKYIKTRFFRFLVSILKNTQNGPRGVYQLVPMQDFTDNSDIEWSKSISDIDHQLYEKYHLNRDEQRFIETHVKAME